MQFVEIGNLLRFYLILLFDAQFLCQNMCISREFGGNWCEVGSIQGKNAELLGKSMLIEFSIFLPKLLNYPTCFLKNVI